MDAQLERLQEKVLCHKKRMRMQRSLQCVNGVLAGCNLAAFCVNVFRAEYAIAVFSLIAAIGGIWITFIYMPRHSLRSSLSRAEKELFYYKEKQIEEWNGKWNF